MLDQKRRRRLARHRPPRDGDLPLQSKYVGGTRAWGTRRHRQSDAAGRPVSRQRGRRCDWRARILGTRPPGNPTGACRGPNWKNRYVTPPGSSWSEEGDCRRPCVIRPETDQHAPKGHSPRLLSLSTLCPFRAICGQYEARKTATPATSRPRFLASTRRPSWPQAGLPAHRARRCRRRDQQRPHGGTDSQCRFQQGTNPAAGRRRRTTVASQATRMPRSHPPQRRSPPSSASPDGRLRLRTPPAGGGCPRRLGGS